MELDPQPSALSAELEQITGEITNAQISSYQAPGYSSTPQYDITAHQPPEEVAPSSSAPAIINEKTHIIEDELGQAPPPPAKLPSTHHSTGGQASENTLTSIPMVVQPVAEAPESIKSEAPVPEVCC